VSNDPWIDPDPQPGDFDADVSTIASEHIERHDGNPDAALRILVSIEGEDARRLERIAEAPARNPATL
jgi:hypothetical protein